MKRRYLYIGIVMLLGLVSCRSGRQYFGRKVTPAEVQIVRFDKAILNFTAVLTDSLAVRSSVEEMYEEYPDFANYWVEDILGIPVEDTAYLCRMLPDFLQDTSYGFMETNKRCEEMFADVSDLQEELNMAFGRLLMVGEYEVPTVYLFVSGFNSSIYGTADGGIGVGVDMYLGSDYEYYNHVVYEYQKQTMRKECIGVDVMSYYLFSHTPYTSEKNRLLEQMIYRGKVMYVVSLLFPEQKPWEVMGYTKEQWDWCVRNEKAIWSLMMDKKDLYKTDQMVMTSYLNDGPFTMEISQDSPGRLGTWMGWRIVESYMEHNEQVSIGELLEEGDAQKVLEESWYRP